MMCFGILIMFCQVPAPQQVDSFCLTYQQIIQAKGDGAIQAPLGTKRRILANELTYRKLCNGPAKH